MVLIMGRIISIGTALPKYVEEQDTILDFMHLAYADVEASRKLNVLFNYSGIDKRYSVIPDFNVNREGELFNLKFEPLPLVEKRLSIFKERAIPLAMDAIQNSVEKINTSIK